MANNIYNIFKENILKGSIDLQSDTIKCVLVHNYTFSASHNVLADVISSEISSGGGYTSGGITLTNKTVTKADITYFDAVDIQITNATLLASGAIIYDDSSTNKDLIAYLPFGGDVSVNAGLFEINFNALGIIGLT